MKKSIIIFALALLVVLVLSPLNVNAKTKAKNKTINMGRFKLTAFCPCSKCSDGWGRRTYSGKTAESGRTIAVDTDIIDIGSKVKIGKKVYVAEDIGGHVSGDHIDIFFDTHEEVEEFGLRYASVKVIREK